MGDYQKGFNDKKPGKNPGSDYPDDGAGYDSGAFVLFLILILLILGSFGFSII